MPKRNAEQKAARELANTEGIGYQVALRRVRAAAEQAAPETPAPQPPAAVAYVLQPTSAEAKLGIIADELGIRALPADATPAQRARAEATWRPTDNGPCRCSGTGCRHGQPCDEEYMGDTDETGDRLIPCGDPLIHVDRYPGSLWGLTDWWDTYICSGCNEGFEAAAVVPDIPWGEQRPTENGVTTVVYDGVRHPNFPGLDEDHLDEDDPDTWLTPEEEYLLGTDAGRADEEPLAEEDQEDRLNHLADRPEGNVDPIDFPLDEDDGARPDEDELGPPSRVRALDFDGQPTAVDWSPLDEWPRA